MTNSKRSRQLRPKEQDQMRQVAHLLAEAIVEHLEIGGHSELAKPESVARSQNEASKSTQAEMSPEEG